MADIYRYMDSLSILPPMFLPEHRGEQMQRNDKRIRRFKELFTRWNGKKEYAMFVDISRQYMEQGLPRQEAMESAIQYCIEQGILAEALTKYRAEGIERANRLNQILIEQDRMEDLKRSVQDSKYQEALFEEFDI